MNRDMLNQTVEGGSIEQYDFDMRRNRLTMLVHVLENAALSAYDLRFEKVSRFEFDTESRSDGGERLEITELWIQTSPESSRAEEWEIVVSIFDVTHLHIRCSSIFIDGDLLR